MKKILIILSLVYTMTYAHTLVMNVLDNEDNTITIEGMYSTGEETAGALVRLESLVTGKILYKKRFPEISELTVDIPSEPYQIVLDGGPGHTIVKKGIAPLEGFSQKIDTNMKKMDTATLSIGVQNTGEWDYTTIFLFVVCLILLILAIYLGSKNTNKILKMIEENKHNIV